MSLQKYAFFGIIYSFGINNALHTFIYRHLAAKFKTIFNRKIILVKNDFPLLG